MPSKKRTVMSRVEELEVKAMAFDYIATEEDLRDRAEHALELTMLAKASGM